MKVAHRARRVMAPPIVAFKDRHRDVLARPDVIDLSQAVPSYGPPPVVVETLARVAGDPLSHRYTPDPGLPECREAVAADLSRRHGVRVGASEIMITPGANAAFHFAANVLLDVGDRATLLSPHYFNHAMSIELLGGRLQEIRLDPERSMEEMLATGQLDGTGDGEVLVLVNPSNPTGRCFGAEGVRALFQWCRERRLRLVVDETYLEFHPSRPDGGAIDDVGALLDAHPSVMTIEGWTETAVAIGSFSKSLAMTGHRVGYVAGSESFLTDVVKVQDTAVVCAPRPAQKAVHAALEWGGLAGWLAERRGEIARRVEMFGGALSGTPGPFWVEDAGAFFAYVAHDPGLGGSWGADDPALPESWRVADRLAREIGVVGLPGSAFGAGESNRLRVAVGNADGPALGEAAGRMQGMRGG